MQAAATAILIGSEVVIAALIGTYLLLRRRSLTTSDLNTRAAGVDSLDGEGKTNRQADDTGAGQVGTNSHTHTIATAADLAAERFALSPREADVLKLLVAGESTAQIQEALCIAPGTFNYHIRNIYAKLGVHSRQELLIFVRNQQEQQKQ